MTGIGAEGVVTANSAELDDLPEGVVAEIAAVRGLCVQVMQNRTGPHAVWRQRPGHGPEYVLVGFIPRASNSTWIASAKGPFGTSDTGKRMPADTYVRGTAVVPSGPDGKPAELAPELIAEVAGPLALRVFLEADALEG